MIMQNGTEGLVDVAALLQRAALASETPEEPMAQAGIQLVIRWWRLNLSVVRDFYWAPREDRWIPGIAIFGRDPQGRFGRFIYYRFDRLTDRDVDLPRVEAFLEHFAEACRRCRQRQPHWWLRSDAGNQAESRPK